MSIITFLISYSVIFLSVCAKQSFSSISFNIDLAKSSPYYGIISQSVRFQEGGNVCFKECQEISQGIDQHLIWAIKALDASGSFQNGFVFHNNFWSGSQTECNRLNAKLRVPISNFDNKKANPKLYDAQAPFKMQIAALYMNYSTRNQIDLISYIQIPIQVGLCVPLSCSSQDLIQLSSNYLDKNDSTFSSLYDVDMEVIDVKIPSLARFFLRTDTILIITLFLLTTLVTILLSCISFDQENSIFLRVQKCVSLKANYENLMNWDANPNAIKSADGLKSITCILIAFVHSLYFTTFVSSNPVEHMLRFFSFIEQFILYVIIYVDTFFTICAFLQTYNFLKNRKQFEEISQNGLLENTKLFFKMILNRYIRLTPALMASVFFSHLIAVYLQESSIYFIGKNNDLYCTNNYWWRNLLYIQNYFPIEEMCSTWTWYLSAEMHYYIIILAGLFIYTKFPRIAKFLFGFLSFSSIAISFIAHYEKNFDMGYDTFVDLKDFVYTPVYVRMNPYFGGVIAAFVLYKHTKINIKPWMKYSLLLLAVSIYATAYIGFHFLFKIPNLIWQLEQSAFRYFYGLLIGVCVLICEYDQKSLFAKFLTNSVFTFLSKLNYVMYLFFPGMVGIIVAMRENAIKIDNGTSLVFVVGISVISYGAAIVFTLFFEVPFIKLSSEFIMKRKIKVVTNNNNEN